MICRVVFFVVGGLLVAAITSPTAGIVHVPGDAGTIQEGINIAQPPDTVMVAADVYPEHIELRSGVCVFGQDAETTIIDGGGVGIDVVKAIGVTAVVLRGFTVSGAISGGSLPGGAGVFINFPHSSVIIAEVIATGNDFGIAVFNGYEHTGPDITACEVYENNFYGISNPGNGLVSGCVIYANHRDGIHQSGNSTQPQIVGNTIWGNWEDGFNYWNDYPATLRNNIFAANGRYGICERSPGTFVDPIVEYNLFWDNAAGNYYDTQSGMVMNTAEEINGMPNAHSNLVADPLFCDPPEDFHLCADSPALGAGMGGADIGAFGEGCGPCGPQSVDTSGSALRTIMRLRSQPNPFQPATTLSFELSSPGHVVMRIYDAGGRMVRTLVAGRLAAGSHRIGWDGMADNGARLSAGAYLVDLRMDGIQVARKVTLLSDK